MNKIAALLLLLLSVVTHVSAQSGRVDRPRVAPQTANQTPNQAPNQNQKQTETQLPPAPANDAQPKTAPAAERVVGDSEDDVVTVETNLVTIPVSVFDRNGRYLPGLQQKDFKVFEDGKEQEVAYFGTSEQPVNVVLVLDTSPSTELRIEQIQDAAISFVNQLKSNDKVMVIEFDANIHVLSEFTLDRNRIAKAIRKADFGDGTSLYDTIENVINKRLSKAEGRKAVVIFTDGVDTTSSKADYYSSLESAEESDAPFYVVYYDTYSENRTGNGGLMSTPYPPIFGGGYPGGYPGGGGMRGISRRDYEHGKRYLDDLSEKSGGRIFSTEKERSLEDAFSGIAEELRRQYNIGYYPTEGGKVGQRKQIKVRVERPSAIVKSRESYIVGGDQQTPQTAEKQTKRKS